LLHGGSLNSSFPKEEPSQVEKTVTQHTFFGSAKDFIMLKPTRRSFLKSSAALAAGNAVLQNAHALASQESPRFTSTPLSQFSYQDVQLLDGPMLVQFRHNHELFLNLNEDSMLKPFRQLSGLPAPGDDMGGWYSPSSEFNPPTNMTGYIPGHSFGQYLSGLSRAYAVTGDKATQAKVQRLVAGFAPTVSQKFYVDYCIPAYTFDKTNCGLIDAYQFAGDSHALAVLSSATDAVLPFLPPKALNREEMMARPHQNVAFTWDETYTLPENFYLAYQRGAGLRYRQLARRFLEDDTYFRPLSENINVLPGQHAYSHVNGLCSAIQCYLTDGSQKHLAAARNGFALVLAQSFATGGWGPNETFQKPNSDGLVDSLHSTHASFETPCGAYGQFKVTRYLMRITGDSRYGDAMETILYNTILGARPIRPDGVSFYYADYNTEAKKVDYEQKWPCCSGTFPQLTADYGISSYLRSVNGINVNLYVPSSVSWRQGSASVSLTQHTSYPANGETAIHLTLSKPERFNIALRVPAWAGSRSKVTVNGYTVGATLAPGTWANLDRTWKDGDRIELSLDMTLRLTPIDEHHPQTVALLYGPVALFAIEPAVPTIARKQLLAAQRIGDSTTWEVVTDSGKMRMLPYPEIKDETYRLYQQT
jgi:DUF1680 family protein